LRAFSIKPALTPIGAQELVGPIDRRRQRRYATPRSHLRAFSAKIQCFRRGGAAAGEGTGAVPFAFYG